MSIINSPVALFKLLQIQAQQHQDPLPPGLRGEGVPRECQCSHRHHQDQDEHPVRGYIQLMEKKFILFVNLNDD